MRRRCGLCFLIGMCIGIVTANIYFENCTQVALLGTYLIDKYPIMEINHARLLRYCMVVRLLPLVYIGVFSLTMFGAFYLFCYVLWLGFSFGALFSAATIQFGVKGVLLCVIGMFPQFLIYFPITFFSLSVGYQIFRRIYIECELDLHNGKTRYLFLLKYILLFLMFITVSIIGIYLESYVNPFLLKKILQIF